MKKLGHITLAALLAFPLSASAQIAATNVQSLSTGLVGLINTVLVPLIFALAFIVFIWGVFQYFIFGGHDEEKRETGKSLMLWGIIGLVIIFGANAIISLISSTVGAR